MEIPQVEASPREVSGSRACRRLRRQGLAPAVLYGRGGPNVLLTLHKETVAELVERRELIVQVSWDGRLEDAQITEVQYDAFGDEILHVDLTRISLSESVEVAVAVATRGEAPGVSEGGVLEIVQHELRIQCLPSAIPEKITVDISGLNIADNLTVADLDLPPGVSVVAGGETVILTVLPPSEVEEEAELAPEELLLEPERIGAEAEDKASAEESE